MKRCSYCGKRYADELTVCATDGQPLVDPEEIGREPAVAFNMDRSFSAKVVSPLSRSGTYRVYVERSELIFINTGGGPVSGVASLAHFLGPAGNLIQLLIWLFSRHKTRAKKQNHQSPEELLREDEDNFMLHAAEIRSAAFETNRLISTWGKAGRLNLAVRHNEKLKIEFDTDAELQSAIQALSSLGVTVRVPTPENDGKKIV